MPLDQVMVGLGDHWFIDVGDDLYFEHLPLFENLVYDRTRRRKHLGILYWHLKRLLPWVLDSEYQKKQEVLPWADFVKTAKHKFSFWGNKYRGRFKRAFEGRSHRMVDVLSRLPILKKVQSKRIFINVQDLRSIP